MTFLVDVAEADVDTEECNELVVWPSIRPLANDSEVSTTGHSVRQPIGYDHYPASARKSRSR